MSLCSTSLGEFELQRKPYVTVKHGKYTLLCRPIVGEKNAFRSVGTFPEGGELKTLLTLVDSEDPLADKEKKI